MRLSTKITQYFIGIVFFALSIGFFIFYFAIERATMQSAIGKLNDINQIVVKKIQSGESVQHIENQHPHVSITTLNIPFKNKKDDEVVTKNHEWSEELLATINRIDFTTYPLINNVQYKITSESDLTVIDDKFFVGIVMVILWIFVFIIIIILFFGEIIARNLYEPFYHLVTEMQSFDVREKKQLQLVDTKIHELDKLNQLFLKTSQQSIRHYESLQEFTENLSHELQTPIANIKGKIDLLLETPLDEEQMQSLSSMYDQLLRVSSINQSLILLMSLENHEITNEITNISELITDLIANQEDLISMKEIQLNSEIQKNIFLPINPYLAEIVFSNLISNSIRHNLIEGNISISLDEKFFIIKNSGYNNNLDDQTVFQRFKKGELNPNSIGIGLALVKKIVDMYGFKIQYKQRNNEHLFTISFEN